MKCLIVQQGKNGQCSITLPSVLVKLKGWGKGTRLQLKIDSKGEIILKEIVKSP